MHDQANELRQLVMRDQPRRTAAKRPKLVLVTGGKGGVGTTTVAVNLAVALARQGRRTVLVDADPAGGDVATLCGIDARHDITDVLSARRTAGEVLHPGPDGLQLVCGAWATDDLRECTPGARQRLIEQLQRLRPRVEILVVDGGNGLHRSGQHYWAIADIVLTVTAPEAASVMDTYAAIKLHSAGDPTAPVRLLVNRAPTREVAEDVGERIARACQRFLGIELEAIVSLPVEPQASVAAEIPEPLVSAAPDCRVSKEIETLALTLAEALARAVSRKPTAGCVPSGPIRAAIAG